MEKELIKDISIFKCYDHYFLIKLKMENEETITIILKKNENKKYEVLRISNED